MQQYSTNFLRAGFRSISDLSQNPPDHGVLRDKCQIPLIGVRLKLLALISCLPKRTSVQADHSPTIVVSSAEPTANKPSHKPTLEKKPPATFTSTGCPIATSSAETNQPKRKVWAIFEPGYRANLPSPTAPSKRPRQATFATTGPNTNSTPTPRKHRFSQRVPGTSFTVDSFVAAKSDPGCTNFFLTHFHSDHYTGLRKTTLPAGARVLCGSITAALIRDQLRVPPEFIRVLPIGRKVDVLDVGGGRGAGASVWLFDANHCPGAVLLLFYVWRTRRYVLHTGDCRYECEAFQRHAKLSEVVQAGQLDYLHLDTTYCDARYKFPTQRDVLADVVEMARAEDKRTRGRCLFFFGTYSVGKERVFLAVAEALDLRIYAGKRKRHLLEMLKFGDRLDKRLVANAGDARVQVVSMRALSADGLRLYAKMNGLNAEFIGRGLAVVFRPTGWSFSGDAGDGANQSVLGDAPNWAKGVGRSRASDHAVVYSVPYSEHSSFSELQEFVRWARPARLVPTVNARSKEQADAMRSLLGHVDRPLQSVADRPSCEE